MVPRATQVATPCTTTSHTLPTVAVIQIPVVTVLQMGFDCDAMFYVLKDNMIAQPALEYFLAA